MCFFYYVSFLVRYGEMFYWGSDIVANTAYGMTLFAEVHRAGWTVPKPSDMLLFGAVYWITRDLWFVHLVLILATAMTVWVGCRLILKHSDSPIGCIAFCVLMMALPRMFRTTLEGGPGCTNVLFLLLAVLFADRVDQKRDRALAVVFLSLANLTRPDSWPCTYLIVLLIFSPRFFDRNRRKWNRSDLWFLLPLGMPLVWVLLDWVVFGDALYSMRIARTFATEALIGMRVPKGAELNKVAAYFPRVQRALFDLFSVSSWFSIRAAVLVILFVAGIGAMVSEQPRTLLLIACPLLGTLLFYFVYALLGTLFRLDYVYSVLVCVALIVSVGLARPCGLVRPVRPLWFRLSIQAGLVCAVLLFLTVGPVQRKIAGEAIPVLKGRAVLSRITASAIESLVADVKRTAGATMILTTQWMPPSRISLKLTTGKDVYLIERLMAKQQLGQKDVLPDLEGKTVYFCFRKRMSGPVMHFLQPLVSQSHRREEIYDQNGLVVLKCFY